VPTAADLALVGIVALSLGVLTAYGQEWLPPRAQFPRQLERILGTRRIRPRAAEHQRGHRGIDRVSDATGLARRLQARGGSAWFATGTGLIAFRGAAALLAGPLVGIFAHGVKSGQGLRPAVGIGAMSGVLVGEGVYGLRFISDSTSPVYWWCEILVGVILAALVVMRQSRRARSAAVAAAAGALAAAAFVAQPRPDHGVSLEAASTCAARP